MEDRNKDKKQISALNEVSINISELKILEEVMTEVKNFQKFKDSNEKFTLKLSDDQAHIISELLKEKLLYDGFDQYYKLNQKGRCIQSLIDRFIEIGW